ncbi:hypothetical protein MXB_1950 [Myxobolus squamalis]|nr:hypothetical protein MXB_1950 [Myxobolus squamalis]
MVARRVKEARNDLEEILISSLGILSFQLTTDKRILDTTSQLHKSEENISNSADCFDLLDNCADLKASNVCLTSDEAMRKSCKKTCGYCDEIQTKSLGKLVKEQLPTELIKLKKPIKKHKEIAIKPKLKKMISRPNMLHNLKKKSFRSFGVFLEKKLVKKHRKVIKPKKLHIIKRPVKIPPKECPEICKTICLKGCPKKCCKYPQIQPTQIRNNQKPKNQICPSQCKELAKNSDLMPSVPGDKSETSSMFSNNPNPNLYENSFTNEIVPTVCNDACQRSCYPTCDPECCNPQNSNQQDPLSVFQNALNSNTFNLDDYVLPNQQEKPVDFKNMEIQNYNIPNPIIYSSDNFPNTNVGVVNNSYPLLPSPLIESSNSDQCPTSCNEYCFEFCPKRCCFEPLDDIETQFERGDDVQKIPCESDCRNHCTPSCLYSHCCVD